jgi:hypothetical protein
MTVTNTRTELLLFAMLFLPAAHAQPTGGDIAGAPMPIRILAQGPAETATDLQVICLFRSAPENTLHGSLIEINQKLKGLIDRIRKPDLFRGELGETLLLTPPNGSLGAKKLLLIGLGDSQTFSPQRMQLVGEIVYTEASRIGVAHPFFAPTILDGGVTKFATGDVGEQVILGFLRAAAAQKVLRDVIASAGQPVADLTFLAGAKNVGSTRDGIQKAISGAVKP